ncbi:MAG: 3-oxoadipate enol-lactonase [Candidatus Acidiferrum sp.]
MPIATLKNVSIHYDLAGPDGAPLLVFSHSLGANLSMWDPQGPELQKRFRVLRFDTRGHGQSSVTPGPYTIELLARDLLALLDHLQTDRVHFCGLSMGGQIGMWLALNAPERLRKLILCNTAAKIGTPEMWNPRIETVRKGGIKSASAAIMARWLTKDYCTKFPAVAAKTLAMLESTNPDGYVASCAAVGDFDVRDAVAKIRVPTLVIAGTRDTATPPADGRYLAGQIAGALYKELNAAHLSNIEDSAHFNSELKNFLLS